MSRVYPRTCDKDGHKNRLSDLHEMVPSKIANIAKISYIMIIQPYALEYHLFLAIQPKMNFPFGYF